MVDCKRERYKNKTPEGKFRMHKLVVCPGYIDEKSNISVRECAPGNPLGKLKFEFHTSKFVFQGVRVDDLSSVLSADPESRRVTAGSIRNHPDDILWLAKRVAPLYGTDPTSIQKNIDASNNAHFAAKSKGIALFIGNYDTDPTVQ
jgi:hypothetical protein